MNDFTDKNEDKTHFITQDGEHFSWQTWVPTTGKIKVVIIAIHGMGSAASEFTPLSELLLPENIALYAPNLRGQGLDPLVQRRGREFNIEQQLSDIHAVISEVRQKHPKTPLLFYGESMGALLVIEYLTKKPGSFPMNGAILAVPIVELARPTSPFVHKIIQLAAKWFPSFKISTKLFKKNVGPLSHDPEKQRFLENVPYRIKKFSVSFLYNMGILIASAHEAAERIRQPVLVLGAGKDHYIHPHQLRQWFNRIDSSDKALEIFPNSYHQLLFDQEQQEVKNSLLRWLKQRLDDKF